MMSEGGLVWQQIGAVKELVLRAAFQKKTSIWRDIVPTRGEGGKKNFEMSLLKMPFN